MRLGIQGLAVLSGFVFVLRQQTTTDARSGISKVIIVSRAQHTQQIIDLHREITLRLQPYSLNPQHTLVPEPPAFLHPTGVIVHQGWACLLQLLQHLLCNVLFGLGCRSGCRDEGRREVASNLGGVDLRVTLLRRPQQVSVIKASSETNGKPT